MFSDKKWWLIAVYLHYHSAWVCVNRFWNWGRPKRLMRYGEINPVISEVDVLCNSCSKLQWHSHRVITFTLSVLTSAANLWQATVFRSPSFPHSGFGYRLRFCSFTLNMPLLSFRHKSELPTHTHTAWLGAPFVKNFHLQLFHSVLTVWRADDLAEHTPFNYWRVQVRCHSFMRTVDCLYAIFLCNNDCDPIKMSQLCTCAHRLWTEPLDLPSVPHHSHVDGSHCLAVNTLWSELFVGKWLDLDSWNPLLHLLLVFIMDVDLKHLGLWTLF